MPVPSASPAVRGAAGASTEPLAPAIINMVQTAPFGPRGAFAVVCLGAVVAPLDSAVNVAFPAITAAFGLELASIRWLIVAYLFTYSGLVMVGGRLGDLYGHRRVFRVGLAIAAAAYLACAAAPAYGWLLAARTLQGIGIALVVGVGPALALSVYPDSARTAVLARYAAVFAIGLALGPLAGGALIDAFDWRAVYWARAPLALCALVLLARVPEVPVAARGRRFDSAGAALLAGWTGALMLALAAPARIGLAVALVAAVGLAVFIARERRLAEPILRPGLFRDPAFALLNVTGMAVNFAGFATFLLGPYFLVRIAGLSSQAAGLVLFFGPASAAVGSALAGRLVPRFGARRVCFAGAWTTVAGIGYAALWDGATPIVLLGVTLLVQGFGIGLFQLAYTDVVVAALPPEDRGVAASLTNLTRMLGVVACASLLSALFRHAEADALGAGLDASAAFLAGFRLAFAVAALVLAVIVFVEKMSATLFARSAS